MRPYLLLALGLVSAGPALAASPVTIPPDLRRTATLCLVEALRLCPDALAAKDHGAACIVGKRRLLAAPCRGLVAQGLQVLNGGDLHLVLRPPKKP